MNQETWDAAVARIAELEAENERLRELMTNRPTTLSAWDNAILDRAERAEAENKALRDKLAELTQVADAYSERAEAELAALREHLDQLLRLWKMRVDNCADTPRSEGHAAGWDGAINDLRAAREGTGMSKHTVGPRDPVDTSNPPDGDDPSTGHVDPSCDNCTTYGDCNISQPPGSATMGCGGKTWMHGEMWVVTDAMDAAEQKLDRAERLKMGLSTAECLRRLEHDGYNPREETP